MTFYNPLVLPKIKRAMSQPIAPGASVLATGGPKSGLVQVPEDVTFYAPLTINTMDYASKVQQTFTRASAAVRNRSEVLLPVNDNASRHERAGLLMESAGTNKCENYNANPDAGLTNLVTGGDASGVLRRISRPDLLADAGLSAICTDGNVFEVDNTGGSGNFFVTVEGGSGNTNTHTASAFAAIDQTTGADLRIKISGHPSPGTDVSSGSLTRIIFSETPPDTSGRFQVVAEAGAKGWFVLNQLEESPVASSVIVTEGAAGQRAKDELRWWLSGEPKGAQVLTDPDICDGATNWNPSASLCGGGTDFGSCYAQVLNYSGAECAMLRQDGTITGGQIYEVKITVSQFSGVGNGRILMGGGTVGRIEGVGVTTFTAYAEQSFIQVNVQNANGFSIRVEKIEARVLTPILNQSEGMAAVLWSPGFGASDVGAGVQRILYSDVPGTIIYFEEIGAGDSRIASTDSAVGTAFVTIPGGLIANTKYLCLLRWGSSQFQVGVKANGTVTWGTAQTYVSFSTSSQLELSRFDASISLPNRNRDLYLWDQDKGTAWLESFFSGVAN